MPGDRVDVEVAARPAALGDPLPALAEDSEFMATLAGAVPASPTATAGPRRATAPVAAR